MSTELGPISGCDDDAALYSRLGFTEPVGEPEPQPAAEGRVVAVPASNEQEPEPERSSRLTEAPVPAVSFGEDHSRCRAAASGCSSPTEGGGAATGRQRAQLSTRTSDDGIVDGPLASRTILYPSPAAVTAHRRPHIAPQAPGRRLAQPSRWNRARRARLPAALLALCGGVCALLYARTYGRTAPLAASNSAAGGTSTASQAPSLADPDPWLAKGLPDPALTPGTIGPQLHVPADAGNVRLAVLRAYGVDPSDTRYVLCRLVPASLGGTDGCGNLFPATQWFAELKARVDARVTALVQSGALRPEQARAALRSNWLRAAHQFDVRNYGFAHATQARRLDALLSRGRPQR